MEKCIEVEASPYIIYVVILPDDGRYKRTKHAVEDKLMHCVLGVVFVLVIKTDVD
jgi:hypothetical protein